MNLNAEQQLVINSPADKICVLAAAGAGKTRCLTERITRIVEEGVPPSAILVLTFTNAGANEMRERFRKRNPEKESPLFCTFHAFCYKLIATDPDVLNAIGYSESPQIADDSAIKRIETTCKQQLGTKLTKGKLNGTEPLTTKDKFEFNLYHKLYRKMLKQSGLITFDILCNDVCSLFVNDDDVVKRYKLTFKFVYADEYQDSDANQHNFILSFTNSNLFVVGDLCQNLYSFRGTDAKLMKSLTEDASWETIQLPRNYRSTKQICDFANEIFTDVPNSSAIKMVSDREGEPVTVRTSMGLETDVQRIISEGVKQNTETVAILCRSNAEVADVKAVFDFKGVSYTSNSKEDDYAQRCQKASEDDAFLVEWLSSKLNASDYSNYIRMCIVDESFKSAEKFIKLYGSNPYYPSIKQSLLDIESKNYKLSTTSQQSNIYIGTIHSVKGLEFDEVFVMNVGAKSFRLKSEDMLNLYYVAVTRAKSKLTVFKVGD